MVLRTMPQRVHEGHVARHFVQALRGELWWHPLCQLAPCLKTLQQTSPPALAWQTVASQRPPHEIGANQGSHACTCAAAASMTPALLRCQTERAPYTNTDLREDPKSRTSDSGFYYSYCVDCRTLWWIYFLDPPGGLGTWKTFRWSLG